MNSITVCGVLTAPPEIKQASNGGTVATLSVRSTRDKGADIFAVAVWGKTAQQLAALPVGTPLFIIGEMRCYTFKGNSERGAGTKWEITAFKVQPLQQQQQAAQQTPPQCWQPSF